MESRHSVAAFLCLLKSEWGLSKKILGKLFPNLLFIAHFLQFAMKVYKFI